MSLPQFIQNNFCSNDLLKGVIAFVRFRLDLCATFSLKQQKQQQQQQKAHGPHSSPE